MRTHKITTDTLYIIIALLSLATLTLSTYLYIQADNKLQTANTIQRATHHTTNYFYQTDDTIEKVQTYTLQPTSINIPNNPPQLHAFIHSGAKITLHHPNGKESTCTLTVINETRAITAGHCGQYGDLVYAHTKTNERIPIGTITQDSLVYYDHPLLGSLDTATIALNPNIIGNPTSINLTTPQKGNPVTIHGQRTQGSQGRVTSTLELQQRTLPVFKTDALVRGGDSGGPVYDKDGNLIGTVQYSISNGESGITPIKNICDSDPTLKCATKPAHALK